MELYTLRACTIEGLDVAKDLGVRRIHLVNVPVEGRALTAIQKIVCPMEIGVECPS